MAVGKDTPLVYVAELVAPAEYTTTQTSVAIDFSTLRRASIIIHAGTCTDGTFTPKLQTSDASGGTYADDDAVLDAFTAISSAEDDDVYKVDIDVDKLDNRFGKLVITATGSPSTGVVVSAVVVGELKES